MEVAWLRTELEEFRSRSSKEINDIQQQRMRENDHWEVREASVMEDVRRHILQVRELESRLCEASVEQAKLKATLNAAEKDEAVLRPELAACEARSTEAEMRWVERSREALTSQEELR